MAGPKLEADAEDMRQVGVTVFLAVLLGVLAQPALARGGSVSFAGGSAREQATVRAALDASSFDWGLIPQTVVVHVGDYGDSYSTYGNVYLDATLLDSGRFAWGVVQHELGHQIDFFLLDDAKRATLQRALGGKDWCYEVAGVGHAEHGCERFASELAWAYWPSPDNSLRPSSPADEAGAMAPAAFRTLLAGLLGRPGVAAEPSTTKAYAPKARKSKRR
jgi:hypothetical protein